MAFGLKFICNACEKERDQEDLSRVVARDKAKDLDRYCRECVNPRTTVPDVYWDGRPEENLMDDPNTGQPRVFGSKMEKANYLKEKGLQEAGDRHHGAPLSLSKNQEVKTDSRHEVKMALKQVREMGIDVRRQQFLKIQKENQIRKEGRRYA